MKIAIAAPTHLPSRRANTVQVMKMAQAVAGLGHEVRVAVPELPVQPPEWGELAHHYGLHRQFPVDWLPASPRWRRYDYGLRALRWARAWGADLLYTRLPQAAAIASLSGLDTILEVHDLAQGVFGPRLLRAFLRGSGARRLVCITQALSQDLERLSGKRLQAPFALVAPDGVDLERYQDLPEPGEARRLLNTRDTALRLPSQFTAGYSGHLYAGRGVELLLEIAARLPEVTFLLAGGEVSDMESLQSAVKSRELSNVRLAGFVPNAELPLYQAACDALLMPYQARVAASSGGDIARYLSPMKLFEYLACGRAILSGDLPVLREVLSDRNAVILPSGEPEAWVTALKDLRTDPRRCNELANQARQDAHRYTWEGRARLILDGLGPEG